MKQRHTKYKPKVFSIKFNQYKITLSNCCKFLIATLSFSSYLIMEP